MLTQSLKNAICLNVSQDMAKTSMRIEKMSESLARLQLENERLAAATTSKEIQEANTVADAVVIESLKAEVTNLTAALKLTPNFIVQNENLSADMSVDLQKVHATDDSDCDNHFYVSPSQSPTTIIRMEKDENRASSPSLMVSWIHL